MINLHFGTLNYLHIEKQIYFSLATFLEYIWKSKEDSYRPNYTTNFQKILKMSNNRNSPSEVLLGKCVLKICSKFTPMPKSDFNKVALQLY